MMKQKRDFCIYQKSLFPTKIKKFLRVFKLFRNKTRATNVIIYIRQFYEKWEKIKRILLKMARNKFTSVSKILCPYVDRRSC